LPMRSKLLPVILPVLLSLTALSAQNVIVNNYRVFSTIYIIIQQSQLFFNPEDETADYQLSVNLLDWDKRPVFQNIYELNWKRDADTAYSNMLIEITLKKLLPGDYKLITLLKNSSLGDKQELIFPIKTTEREAITSFIIAKNDGISFTPGKKELPFINADKCNLIVDTKADCDSVVLEYKTAEQTRRIPVQLNSGYYFDLLPLLKKERIEEAFVVYYNESKAYKVSWFPEFNCQTLWTKYSTADQLLQIKYIVSQTEWKLLKKLSAKSPEAAISYFWRRHSNTPESGRNDLREMFYARVQKADELFTLHKKLPGWKSDRGRIYIIKGEPDEIIGETFPSGKKPYIIWRYFRDGLEYLFVDKTGYGNYTLEEAINEN